MFPAVLARAVAGGHQPSIQEVQGAEAIAAAALNIKAISSQNAQDSFQSSLEQAVETIREAIACKQNNIKILVDSSYAGHYSVVSSQQQVDHNIMHETWNKLSELISEALRAQGYKVEEKFERTGGTDAHSDGAERHLLVSY